MKEPGVWKWEGVREKPDLPEAFRDCCIHELGGESGGPPVPQKKLNLGLTEMQFHTVLRGYLHLQSLLSRYSITFSIPFPPHPICLKISTNSETQIFKKWVLHTPTYLPLLGQWSLLFKKLDEVLGCRINKERVCCFRINWSDVDPFPGEPKCTPPSLNSNFLYTHLAICSRLPRPVWTWGRCRSPSCLVSFSQVIGCEGRLRCDHVWWGVKLFSNSPVS